MGPRAWAAGLAASVVLVSGLAFVAPAAGTTSSDRFAIGDSVMLGARSALKELGFRVDATESRQSYSAPRLIRQRADRLPENVVVHLGTNGSFPLATCKAIVRAAGKDRRVFLVNVYVARSWEDRNNAVIRQCDEAFRTDRVHVVDWNEAVSANPGWLYGDRIHLRPSGGAAFARLIDRSVDQAVATARAAARVAAIARASGSSGAGLEG